MFYNLCSCLYTFYAFIHFFIYTPYHHHFVNVAKSVYGKPLDTRYNSPSHTYQAFPHAYSLSENVREEKNIFFILTLYISIDDAILHNVCILSVKYR